MNIVFDSTCFCIDQWQQAFSEIGSTVTLLKPHSVSDDKVDVLLLWKPVRQDWTNASGLKLVFFLGAGVDMSQGKVEFRPGVSVTHFKDAGMKRAMCDYVSYALMHYQRRFDHFQQCQQKCYWEQQRAYRTSESMRVTVLGLGSLGAVVATHLAALGYQVCGWSRSAKQLDNVQCVYGGESLYSLLARTEVLVNMLPDTPKTRHLIGMEVLAALPQDAVVISLSRGSVIDTQALLTLLDTHHLRGAFMDVFEQEPLMPNDPLWHHPKITITPHQSAPTQALDGAKEIVVALQHMADNNVGR